MRFYRTFSTQPNLIQFISKLRNQTELSINLCRKAAIDSNYDLKLALEILSKSSNYQMKPEAFSGISNFGKEGLVGVYGNMNRKCLIELRCDSDFVARNTEFIGFANDILMTIISSEAVKTAENQSQIPNDQKIQEQLNYYRSKFRENIGIQSFLVFEIVSSNSEAVGHYIHQRIGDNTGKIGSLVKIRSEKVSDTSILEEISNSLSRQIVGLGDPKLNIINLLNSEYLFSSIGTVRKFIELYEEKINSKINVLDMAYVKIK